MTLTRRALPLLLATPAISTPALAQPAWPDRPVRIIVPYAPGGANDLLARLVAQRMSERLGQPVVVENRAGAQATLGTSLVARAQPDGLTLLVAASGPISVSAATNPRLPYQPLRDLAPITILASFPLVLLVPGASPHRTVADLVAWLRANPDRGTYSSSAASFQLATELFAQTIGVPLTHVAYRGSAESAGAVAAGDVTLSMVDSAPATPVIQAGRARALAVTAPARLAAFPDVPTMAEAGMPALEVALWAGLFAPAATPAPILARLHEEALAALAHPEVAGRIRAMSMTAEGNSAADFRTRIGAEISLWAEVARRGNIRFED